MSADFRISEYLAAELKRRDDMSPSEFARVAGLSRSTVSRILSGDREGEWETLTRIAQALHMTRAQLVAAVDGQPLPDDDERTERAIRCDGNLTPKQRESMLSQYRTYRYPEQRAPRRRGRPPSS